MLTNSESTGLRGYAICTQPRSGSNLLSQYLASTDCLGYPLEYFNTPGRRALGIPDFPDEPRKQIEYILRHGATPNGVYGVKLFSFQHDLIAPTVRWTEALPQLRFVYLDRKDLLGQAISWTRAIQANQYRSTQPVQAAVSYDGRMILNNLLALIHERSRWEGYFARTGIAPLRISYEYLVADPQTHVNRLAQIVEVDGPVIIDPARVDLSIQRDSLSEEWRRRFHEEFGNADVIHMS